MIIDMCLNEGVCSDWSVTSIQVPDVNILAIGRKWDNILVSDFISLVVLMLQSDKSATARLKLCSTIDVNNNIVLSVEILSIGYIPVELDALNHRYFEEIIGFQIDSIMSLGESTYTSTFVFHGSGCFWDENLIFSIDGK